MGGKTKTTTTTNQNTTQNTSSNSVQGTTATQAGDRAIPGLEAAFNTAVNTPTYGANGERFTVENGNWTGPTTAVAGTPGQSLVTDPNYTGPMLAGPNTGQTEGAQGLIDYGRSQEAPIGQFVNSAQDWGNRVASGEFLDPNNDVLQGYIRSLAGTADRKFQLDLNAMRDASVEGGAYSGTPFANQTVLAQGENQKQFNDSVAARLFDWYQQEQSRIERNPQFMSAVSQTGTLPFQYQTQGGNQQNALDQIGIDNNRTSYEATRANEQQALNEAEWQRQQQYFIDQQKLVNQQGTFAGNVANQEDAIREQLMQYQSDIEGTYAPWEAYFNLLGKAPTTGFSNSTGTSNGTSTGTSTSVQQQQPSGLQIASGLAGLGLTAATGGVGGGFWGAAAKGLTMPSVTNPILSNSPFTSLNPFINPKG